jgi:hypothetical protein
VATTVYNIRTSQYGTIGAPSRLSRYPLTLSTVQGNDANGESQLLEEHRLKRSLFDSKQLILALAGILVGAGFSQPAAAAAAAMRPEVSNIAINAANKVVLAIATSFVTWYYQRLSKLDEVRRNERDHEIKRAGEAFYAISTITDQLWFHQAMEFIEVVTRKAKTSIIEEPCESRFKALEEELQKSDKQRWETYCGIYEKFASSESRSLAKIHCSFGLENRNKLERTYRVFENAHLTLQATYYYNRISNSKSPIVQGTTPGEWTYEGREELETELANSKSGLKNLYQNMLRDIHTTNVGILRKGGID